MKNYHVSEMLSTRGVYTGIWAFLGGCKANTYAEALHNVSPICRHYDIVQGCPSITRPRAGVIVYEYENKKFCVEQIAS